jgi:hypothetical protein
MAINFPTNNVRNGDVYSPPESPDVVYVYNAARGMWIIGGANSENHPVVAAFLGQPGLNVDNRGSTGDRGVVGSNGPVNNTLATGRANVGPRGATGNNGPVGSNGIVQMTTQKDGQTVTLYSRALNFIGSRVTVTNGANNTAQIAIASPGSVTRSTVVVTTASLANGAGTLATVTIGAKTYVLYSIEASAGAWVIIYSSSAAAEADQTRTILADPAPGSGIVAEAITTGSTSSKLFFTPAVFGANNDEPPTNIMYVRINNNSGASAALTVNITYLPMEN